MAGWSLGAAFDLAGARRSQRRGTVQRRDLTFLFDAQHKRTIRRRKKQANDLPDLLDEEWMVAQLECLGTVRCERMARQTRLTVDRRSPQAMSRVDQRMAVSG